MLGTVLKRKSLILNQFHGRKSTLWKFKKFIQRQDPPKFIFPLPLGRGSKFCLWVFSLRSRCPMRSMNISKSIYTFSGARWNNFVRIKYVSNQFHYRKSHFARSKNYRKSQEPQKLYLPSHLDVSFNFVYKRFLSILDVL